MKKLSIISLLIGAALGGIPQDASPQQQIGVINVTVARHTDMFSDGGSTQKLIDATSLLQTINSSCANDQRVCTSLVKSGSTTTFGLVGDGLDNITSQAELDAVYASGNTADVKVVMSMSNCCESSGSVQGCTQLGSRIPLGHQKTVLVRDIPAAGWAHECGHAQNILGDYSSGCQALIMGASGSLSLKNSVTRVNPNFEDEVSLFEQAPDSYAGTCTSGGLPSQSSSFYVPQSGSTTNPNEGGVALASFRRCPNSDGTQNLPLFARLKVVLRDASNIPIAGIQASEICLLFNGGPPAQGFSGPGDDSIIANWQFNQAANCPDVRCVQADAASDGNGVAYISLIGASATPGQGTRDPFRKWGGYSADIPVFASGIRLDGYLTTAQGEAHGIPSFSAHVRSLDFVGGYNTATNQGERVNSLDIAPVQAAIGGPYEYNMDFDLSGSVNSIDLSLVKSHNNHKCNTPLNP